MGNLFEERGCKPYLLLTPHWFGNENSHSRYIEHGYRVGVGTGSQVIPSAIALKADEGSHSDSALYDALGIYSTVRGLSAEHSSYAPQNMAAESYSSLAAGVNQTLISEAVATHYETPFQGVVKLVEAEIPDTYRFMISGTSSERGYRGQMSNFLSDQGISSSNVDIGHCNQYKTVDEECMERASSNFSDGEFMSIYARGYDVSTSDFVAAGGGGIQLQVYDRHWDATENDGGTAIDQLEYRTVWFWNSILLQDLAFLPQHLNFAKLKVADPSVSLLSDGVHATNYVQYGLAAMSFVSRTGVAVTYDGLDQNFEKIARFGEETIRQWSTLSETGEYVPEH